MAEGVSGKIKALGDLKRPVRAGEPFAKVVSGAKAQDFVPQKIRAPNWTVAKDGATLVSGVLGRVLLKAEGLLVRPLWTVSKDRTILTVAVYPTDYLDRPITVEDISQAVSEGAGYPPLDPDALEAAVARAAETGEPQPGCVLAKGTPPAHGRDAKLKLAFRQEKQAGAMRSDGSMDFRERGVRNHMTAGELMAVLYPATKGAPGEDIFGRPVAAVDGRQLQIKAGDGVLAEGQGETIEFKAAVDGLPEFRNGVLRICQTLEVEGDVDMDSGNLHSPHGSVSVKGAVRTGFTVLAGKDVTVHGMVEDAVIEAGGDLHLEGGVHMADSGLLRVGGQVSAKFMEHARIDAGGDVSTKMDIIQCDITSGGKVVANEGQGNIVGGVIRCRGGVTAREIGNENAVATIVEVVVRGPRGAELEAGIKELQAKQIRLTRGVGSDDALDALLHAPEEDRRILAQLIKVKSDVQSELKVLDKELEADMLQAELELADTAIKVTGTVHPGVTIRIAGRAYKVTEAMPATVFRWNPRLREIETA